MEEIWKPINGYEGLYEVSNLGRVKSLKYYGGSRTSIRKFGRTPKGYLQVWLHKNHKSTNFYVHRLVASAFIPNPNNLPNINHKDENPNNNVFTNLEWCDQKYNCNYGRHNERLAISLKGNVPWNKGLFGKDNPQTGSKRSEETRRRIIEVKTGYKWYTNGIEQKQVKGNPPEGWMAGRLKWEKQTSETLQAV